MRGFGTALMHGGATAMYAVIAHEVQETRPQRLPGAVLAGFLLAYCIHSAYNHFFLSPVLSALLTVVGVPLAMSVVYRHSERSTQSWLGVGFDTDRELYTLISSGTLAENNVGKYLQSLQQSFPPTVVADMLCYLRTYAELAIGAKAVMMMREAGLDVPPDPTVPGKLKEMEYLRKSIGRAGLMALSPFVHTRSSDLAHLRRWSAWALAAAYPMYASLGPSRTALHLSRFERPGRKVVFGSDSMTNEARPLSRG